jgi:hypothetical protein
LNKSGKIAQNLSSFRITQNPFRANNPAKWRKSHHFAAEYKSGTALALN